nr:immunoglobulin heavy chain junction region [Macaca mulatta]MOW32733.1 immunoglobulin heavy chain junction region [Macaca mulatta]MOW32831.1 immunoglobulin heavy chain junction region [Macaca mulatta]MOW33214.1 immunoglobulin heavy chain junction region [Macaca mulatta]MOW33576.1 immunoglobulin heavy chain junction region [Macaca mulatta]
CAKYCGGTYCYGVGFDFW